MLFNADVLCLCICPKVEENSTVLHEDLLSIKTILDNGNTLQVILIAVNKMLM